MDIFSSDYPVIQTKRLALRPLENRDLASLYELYNSPDTQAFQSKHYYSVEALGQYISGQTNAFRSKEKIMWGIERKADGKLIGVRILYNDGNQTFEIQGDTRTEFWRQGYTKEAYRAIIDFLKKSYEKCTVYGKVQAQNIGAKRLLESLEFTQTGMHQNNGITFLTYTKEIKKNWISKVFSV
ncbi:GNAT family N-acetyltransferase [Flaviaesturariibacter amylovorans]|uniref:GNAT family protein n=1 Tax=Flaviaesturariibacter amylovorans TaxID=1084520 RepID=A0ABP8HHT2_9BACT